jgi:hypothetical protein
LEPLSAVEPHIHHLDFAVERQPGSRIEEMQVPPAPDGGDGHANQIARPDVGFVITIRIERLRVELDRVIAPETRVERAKPRGRVGPRSHRFE